MEAAERAIGTLARLNGLLSRASSLPSTRTIFSSR
jgi:hypothetical protein